MTTAHASRTSRASGHRIISFALPQTAVGRPDGNALATAIDEAVPASAPRINLDLARVRRLDAEFVEGLARTLTGRGKGVHLHLWSMYALAPKARRVLLDGLAGRARIMTHDGSQTHTRIITAEIEDLDPAVPEDQQFQTGMALGVAAAVTGPISLDLHLQAQAPIPAAVLRGMLVGAGVLTPADQSLTTPVITVTLWGPGQTSAAGTARVVLADLRPDLDCGVNDAAKIDPAEYARRVKLRDLMASYGPAQVAASLGDTAAMNKLIGLVHGRVDPAADSTEIVTTATEVLGSRRGR